MKQLLQPLEAPHLHLHNRLVLPPMATAKANVGGAITPQLLAYYNEKTQGGYLGLVVVEHSFVLPQGKASAGQMSVSSDEDVEGMRQLAQVIQKNGSKAAMQLNHAGSAAFVDEGGEPVAPSAVPHPNRGTMPAALTISQIQEIVEAFAKAAVRTKKAGFDAVEVHSAHGYLLNQFYSPLTNHRTDQYGGNLKNRVRLHLEILAAVRQAVGEDYPILLRFGGCDYREGGSTLQDAAEAARLFEQAGVSVLDLSGGFCGYTPPHGDRPGYFADLTRTVKQAVGIPVVLTGGITTAQQAEQLLQEGAADLIGVGRAILKDSHWGEKEMQNF